jgi:hypothetical protein
MNRVRIVTTAAAVAAVLAATTHTLRADVRADEKTRVEFAGMLGRMYNLFGGKAAREGVTTSVAVKGDRKATLNSESQTGQIIDLAEEKVYDLDLKKKTYRVTTFAEVRRKMEETQKKAEDNARKQESKPQSQPQQAPPKDEKQMQVDVDVKNTGQRKAINGFDTREMVVTVTVHEKGKTLEQSGGMVMTTDSWLTPKIAAMKEVADFDARYAQKMAGSMIAGVSADQMAAAMTMYPEMKQAMGRMTTEGAKLDGTAILTTLTMDGVKSQEQMAEEAKQKDKPEDSSSGASGGVSGLLGNFAKKAAAKKSGGDEPAGARATVMTTTLEVLKVTTELAASDVAVPMGFKEAK